MDSFLAHGLLPFSKCLPGRLPGRAGEVERAVPEAGHMRRRWWNIRVDPIRGPVVCGAGQRPRGPGERQEVPRGLGGGERSQGLLLELLWRGKDGASVSSSMRLL